MQDSAEYPSRRRLFILQTAIKISQPIITLKHNEFYLETSIIYIPPNTPTRNLHDLNPAKSFTDIDGTKSKVKGAAIIY